MRGAVLLIGSLLWEDVYNSLNQDQGAIRRDWRKQLEMSEKTLVEVPIRYGRISTSRKNTYTMVFSTSVKNPGKAFIIPFKIETNNFQEIKYQALGIANAEGISNLIYPNRLTSNWGTIGIAFNSHAVEKLTEIRSQWHKEFLSFNNLNYGIAGEAPSIQKNGELNFDFKIPEYIDYVFATTVKPDLEQYPSVKDIVNAVNNSTPKYDTYIKENFQSGIRALDDEEILSHLK